MVLYLLARLYAGDHGGCRVVGRAVIHSVDIGEYHERLGTDHAGDEAGQFVVVGEHQLGDAHSVVLVDDGQDMALEHDLHAALLVVVFLSLVEILLHGEHLAHGYAVVLEQSVI